jgi:hypothetical protein
MIRDTKVPAASSSRCWHHQEVLARARRQDQDRYPLIAISTYEEDRVREALVDLVCSEIIPGIDQARCPKIVLYLNLLICYNQNYQGTLSSLILYPNATIKNRCSQAVGFLSEFF